MKFKDVFIDLFEDGKIVKNVNTTVDINVDSIKIQSKKLCNNVSIDGVPPVIEYDNIKNSLIKKEG